MQEEPGWEDREDHPATCSKGGVGQGLGGGYCVASTAI